MLNSKKVGMTPILTEDRERKSKIEKIEQKQGKIEIGSHEIIGGMGNLQSLNHIRHLKKVIRNILISAIL